MNELHEPYRSYDLGVSLWGLGHYVHEFPEIVSNYDLDETYSEQTAVLAMVHMDKSYEDYCLKNPPTEITENPFGDNQ